ncbi:gamma-glutamylcyclotransferase family protein [Rosistilla oblonga]|uniref:gamma-glutamylcyclotransferase family protein n=1 Tax=Rosistilla oblonga TaxID=2527990 RepID=UPI003A969C7E
MDAAVNFFVYGTLKRGECRERMWPHAPLQIQAAFVRGCLYDLGPYPAMIAGGDWVAGEVWSIATQHVQQTLAVLDEIEDYDASRANNLYNRLQVPWHLRPDAAAADSKAYTYHYARTEYLMAGQRIKSPAGDPVQWPSVGSTA